MVIRARMTLDDGVTPGAMRHGSIHINALLARGCRIVPDPMNNIPTEYTKFVLKMDEQDAPRLERKRGRPRKDADVRTDTE
jgi:hypothetical protein